MSELDALNEMATIISGITSPALLTRTWVYPRQESSISLTTFPAAIVSIRATDTTDTIGLRIGCEYWYEWTAEILLALGNGPLKYPGAASAAVEALQFEYPAAIAKKLMANPTLNGTCEMVGEVGEGVPILTIQRLHFQWEQAIYWGLVMTTRVAQSVEIL